MSTPHSATSHIIDALARPHLGKGSMPSSAQLCYDDARELMLRGDYFHAAGRAVDCLSYTVGIFHADTQEAIRLQRELAQ